MIIDDTHGRWVANTVIVALGAAVTGSIVVWWNVEMNKNKKEEWKGYGF